MGIKVNQFDTTGKLLAMYDSYSLAAEHLSCNESTIRKAARDNKLVFGKFYFEDAELRKLETQIDGLYEIVPSSNLNEQPEILEIADNKPKILLLDIETSLLLANVFQKQVWKARIGSNLIISDYYMLTWSAKWLGEAEIYSDRLTVEEVLNEDDKRITINLWSMLDQAEIVIGHNSDSFDIPNIYTRCVYHELPPPSPFRQVDTLKIAQKYFGFTHNGLDALCKFFKMPGKIHTNVELWKSCIRGDEDALIEMETYNRQDVKALEDVFYKLRPYAKNLPNLNMYQDSSTITCPSCGSIHMNVERHKYFYTNATKFQVYRCTSCGATSRSRKGLKISERFVSPIPR